MNLATPGTLLVILEQTTTTPIRYFSVRRVGKRVEFLSSKRYKNDHPEQIVKVELYIFILLQCKVHFMFDAFLWYHFSHIVILYVPMFLLHRKIPIAGML